MSVPTWKRNLSRTEYLYKTYLLEKNLVQFIYNTPSKYRRGFGDTIVGLCDSAMLNGRIANGIYVKDKESLDLRLYHLEQMKASIDNICTHVYIWVEAMRQHDGISSNENEKLYDKEYDIGLYCDEIISLIEGVKRSDKKLYKTKIKKEETAHS